MEKLLFMQPQGALSFTELVLNASFLVQCVMLFLLALSIASWTIIISRNNQYRIGRAKADAFEDRFWSGIDLNNLYQDCMKRPDELVGLEVIYSAGFKEFVRLVNSGPADQDVVMDGTYRQMKVACSREVELLENHLPTLATIGSISPYIGLFGTVWGIMHAFVALAAVKNATLAMVAPPIAEALIATAMGLFAAIPAVMFYNRFVTKVEALENRYYNFMDEFSTILNRRLVTIRSQLNRHNAPVAPESVGSSPNGNDLSAMNNLNALNPSAASTEPQAAINNIAPPESGDFVRSKVEMESAPIANPAKAPARPISNNATVVNNATPAAINPAPRYTPQVAPRENKAPLRNNATAATAPAATYSDPNYRGIVPPRGNNPALNNAHLLGGSAVITKGAPSSAVRANPNYRPVAPQEVQYITPGTHANRREQ